MCYIVIIGIFCSGSIQATDEIYDHFLQAPKVVPFSKFGDYSLDNNTGSLNLSVPLYDIECGTIKIPINISYKSNGRKISDDDGTIGYGWELNFGGKITRDRRGLCDENGKYNFIPKGLVQYNDICYNDEGLEEPCLNLSNSNVFWNLIDYKTATEYNTSFYDSKYDIFTYSLPSATGNFILYDTIINGLNTKKAFTIPYNGIEVNIQNYQTVNSKTFINYIIITDIDGTEYHYGKSLNKDTSYYEFANSYNLETIESNFDEESPFYVSAWNITAIVSPDKSDTVFYEYGSRKIINNSDEKITDATFVISDKFIRGGTLNGTVSDLSSLISKQSFDYDPKGMLYNNVNYHTINLIKEIRYKGNKINFNFNASKEFINDFVVSDNLGVFVKNCRFYHSKYTNEICESLDSIVFIKNLKTLEKYSFEYYRGYITNNTKAVDWWGYYNGKNNNLLIPNFDINYVKYDNSTINISIKNNIYNIGGFNVDKTVVEDYKKIGLVKSITYPTGGKTEFSYENNKYNEFGILKDGPGLRISEIRNYPINSSEYSINYCYSNENFPNYLKPVDKNFISENRIRSFFPIKGNWNEQVWTEYYGDMDGQYYYITAALEYSSSYGSNIGLQLMDYRSRNFSSSFSTEETSLSSNRIHYGKIVEKFNGGENGSTEYEYSTPEIHTGEYLYNEPPYDFPKREMYFIENKLKYRDEKFAWKGNNLIQKTIKDRYGNTLQYTSYCYSPVLKSSLNELSAKRYFNFIDNSDGYYHQDIHINENDLGSTLFCYALKSYTSGKEILTRTTDCKDGVVQIKDFEYDTNYLMLKKVKIWNSKSVIDMNGNPSGANITKEFYYPFDNQNVNVYNQMTNKNILNTVVEEVEKNEENEIIKRTKTNYDIWWGSKYLPTSIQRQYFNSNEWITLKTFDNYNVFGNPTKIHESNLIYNYYIWGYNHQYPIAKIESSNSTDINITVNDESLSKTDNLTDIQNGINYIKSKLLNYLNDINYKVTIYTYKPLVGLTSTTDPRGATTYYEYDEFNRLKFAKDKDGNVLQNNAYHYSIQQ